MNRAVLFVLGVALFSGCAGLAIDSTPAEPSPESGPTPSVDRAGTVSGGDQFSVTVVDVVDGDTIDVRYSNGSTDTVRLLGIDTPEVSGSNDPTEFEGVPDTETGEQCLENAGQNASAALRERIASENVQIVVDPSADRRDRYGRLLAYVVSNGTDLNHWLIETGHARLYDSTFSRSDAYSAAESEAQNAGIGVWQCQTVGTSTQDTADSILRIAAIHADAAGNDHENLDDEYVVFENTADTSLDLSGWTVRDETGYSYTVPDGFSLAAGARVTLRTGTGQNTDETLYWGRDSAVWNNGGDTVTVVNESGRTVLTRTYS